MSTLQKIVYLTEQQYADLATGTLSGHPEGVQDDILYITTDPLSFNGITGILPVTKGGTGASNLASGALLVGNGENAITTISKTSDATGGTVVVRDSSGNFSAGTITATLSGTASYANNLANKSLTTTTINNTAGSFAFSIPSTTGMTQITSSNTDYVGLQMGDSVDKWQLTATSNNLFFRQNDNGGTNTSWNTWVQIASSANVGTGDSNGQIKIAGTNVAVKGLKALAYLDSLSYSDVGAAPSSHNHNASDINAGTLALDRIPSITNAKLAGSISNDKLSNSSLKVGFKTIALGETTTGILENVLGHPNTVLSTDTSWDITDMGIYRVSSVAGAQNPGSTTGETSPYGYGELIVTRAYGYGAAQFYISHHASDTQNAAYGIRYRSGWNVVDGSRENGASPWLAWATILDSHNYNLYSPKLDGTGATGSWGISITGNAANITGTLALANLTKGDANTALMGKGSSTAPAYVSVTPSISITAGTADNAPKVNLTVLGVSGQTAQELTKASTSVYGATKLYNGVDSTSTALAATANAVKTAYDKAAGIVAAADAMVFKGVKSGADPTAYTPAANRGDTYKVDAAGLINGERVEVGDILICTTDSTSAATSSNVNTVKANWVIVQNNIDGAVFYGSNTLSSGDYLVADGANGKVKTQSLPVADDTTAGITTVGASGGAAAYSHGTHVSASTVKSALGASSGGSATKYLNEQGSFVTVTAADVGAATSGHTHNITITDGGSSAKALSANTTYTLTAGGKSVVFTTPADNNTATAVSNILEGSNSGTAITYKPYTQQQTDKLSFDTSTSNPSRTDRLNLNGYLYATKLYSGNTEVSVSGHTHSYAGSSSAGGAATSANALNFVHGNEILIGNKNEQAGIHINHRRVYNGATSGNTAITDYYFKNGNGSTTGVTIHAASFDGNASSATSATTATNLASAPTLQQTGTSTIDLVANKAYTLTVGGQSIVFKTPADSNTDTLVNYTLGATTRAYLMGSQNAPTSTATARAAHGDMGVYLSATAGQLSAKSLSLNDGAASASSVEKVYMQWNSADQSLDFIFA